MLKTLSTKIDEAVLKKLDAVCEEDRLVKSKIIEDALRDKLDELAEKRWAVAMISERNSQEHMSLKDLERKISAKPVRSSHKNL